jgi:hypothetical protein
MQLHQPLKHRPISNPPFLHLIHSFREESFSSKCILLRVCRWSCLLASLRLGETLGVMRSDSHTLYISVAQFTPIKQRVVIDEIQSKLQFYSSRMMHHDFQHGVACCPRPRCLPVSCRRTSMITSTMRSNPWPPRHTTRAFIHATTCPSPSLRARRRRCAARA